MSEQGERAAVLDVGDAFIESSGELLRGGDSESGRELEGGLGSSSNSRILLLHKLVITERLV